MRPLFVFLFFLFFSSAADGQGTKGLLGNQDIVSGLKEALATGAVKGTSLLSKENGFFKNELLKIVLPPEVQKAEKTLRSIGMGKQFDDAILSMNRGAEEACKQAAPIFVNAIRSMDVGDAVGILRGGDTAATTFLRKAVTPSLTESFRPVIDGSLKKVDATRYWSTIINAYNKISLRKINPDLASYVTERAIHGVFVQIAEEEKEIRKNPAARTTDLLKKVFQ